MATARLIDPVRLDKLALIAVRVGLDLKAGQDLLIVAPLLAVPLVRRITLQAYRAGAGLVTPIYTDDEAVLARFALAPDAAFDKAAGWLYAGMAEAYKANTARLVIVGSDPMLLAGQDPDKVARASRAESVGMRPSLQLTTSYAINWTKLAYPGLDWARRVFPDHADETAVRKLADIIFAASRADLYDPIAAWAQHNANLRRRSDWLNGKRFAALRFTGPGTDLTVGLADGHRWKGGASLTRNGANCNPNIPTEEVFTAPHRLKVSGHARATKPLANSGTLVEEIQARFEEGRLVDLKASKGADLFDRVLDADEGARRLGEVALVPASSPIAQSGLLFYTTLFDENAASHIAMGQCYADCFIDGTHLSREQITAQGGNTSLIHVDWMIGSKDVDVDGIATDGNTEPVMRHGEWA